MTTPAGDREGLAALPPVAAGDVPAGSADLWGGDGAVSDACQEREQRLSGDEAQLRMPFG